MPRRAVSVLVFAHVVASPALAQVRRQPIAQLSIVPAATISAATPSSSTVQLTWSPASDGPVQVLRGLDPAGPFVIAASLGAGASSFTDVRLNPNTTYQYQVVPAPTAVPISRRVALANVSTSATAPLATTAFTPGVPGPAVTGTCTYSNAGSNRSNFSCNLSWTPVPGAVAYEIYGQSLQVTRCGWSRDFNKTTAPAIIGGLVSVCGSGWKMRAVFRMDNFPAPGTNTFSESGDSQVIR